MMIIRVPKFINVPFNILNLIVKISNMKLNFYIQIGWQYPQDVIAPKILQVLLLHLKLYLAIFYLNNIGQKY